MYKSTVFLANELILEHSQPNYMGVLKTVLQLLTELVNNGAKDYRIMIKDKEGNLRFSAIGESTQIINMGKG